MRGRAVRFTRSQLAGHSMRNQERTAHRSASSPPFDVLNHALSSGSVTISLISCTMTARETARASAGRQRSEANEELSSWPG